MSNGCTYGQNFKIEEPFRKIYDEQYKKQDTVTEQKKRDQLLITLSAHKVSFSLFARIISDKYKIGFVYSEALAEKLITAEFKDTDLEDFLNVLSRQLSTEVLRIGNTFYVGSLRPDDRGVFCRKIYGYSKEQLQALFTPILSPAGKLATEQSLLIVADSETVLRRVAELAERLMSLDRATWILQLYFVNLRKDALAEAGFSTKSSGKVSYDISNQKVSADDLLLEGAFQLLNESNYGDLYASPMLFVRDSTESKWSDGEIVPVPRKSVSNYGVVTTQGFDYINTGLNIGAYCSESASGTYLRLTISLSEIVGYVEYAPVQKSVSYNFESDMMTGKLYLIGELTIIRDMFKQERTFDFSAKLGKSAVQLWAKVYRVGQPVDNLKYPKIQDHQNYGIDQTGTVRGSMSTPAPVADNAK